MVSFADIIFLMLIVAFIITRLYSVFGTHTDNQKVKVIIKPLDKDTDKNIVENITKMIKENKIEAGRPQVFEIKDLVGSEKAKKEAESFDKDKFLRGACRVFEIVIQAFNSGNLSSIKELVSKKVWEAFNAAAEYRKQNNLTAEVDFICFAKTEIKDIKFLKNSIKVVVEFVSEQVNILKNENNEVIEGDENFVQKITDVWTFERSINAKNSNWLLVSTKKS